MSKKKIEDIMIVFVFIFLIGCVAYIDVLLIFYGDHLLSDTGVFVFLCATVLTVLANVLIFWILRDIYLLGRSKS